MREINNTDVVDCWFLCSEIWKYEQKVSCVCCYNHFDKVPRSSSSNSMPILLFSTLSFLQQALCGRSLSLSLPFCFSCYARSSVFIDSEGVSGLSWSVDEKSLKDAFSSFGDVTEVRIVYDKDSGRPRGFGFVIFSNEDDAKCAKDAMDGKALLGRPLRINFALEKARGVPVVVPRLSDIGHLNRH
ncbi:Glycine-rich RNA-binding protein 4 [Spatholobus suberectus]|nr:Glycine-rich RNA-binding protein 4 [Spatholobus suberectus]